MSIFQTYIGSAYASHPVRWIESPEATRTRSEVVAVSEKSAEKIDPDLGKPRSASGDVLDLSQGVRKTQETSRSDAKVPLDADKLAGGKTESTIKSTEKLPSGEELTPEEQQKVDELKARDQEVRTHEMAHVMAGGSYVTSGPSYEYEVGPDGNGYAVGGSVGIDTSPVEGDPEATIAKMQTVAAAALAPAKPSGPDLKVAAAARQAESKARAELVKSQTEQLAATGEQQGKEEVATYTIVRAADKAKTVADPAMSSIRSYSASSSKFAPSSAYEAQSVMTLATPRFTAFA